MASNNQLNTSTVPIPVTSGGSGTTSFNAYCVLTGGTTSTGDFQSVASVGTAKQVLTSNGGSALPTFQDQDWQFITGTSATSVASVSFTDLSSTFYAYKFIIHHCQPATDAVGFYSRLSTDNGSTWISSASAYNYRQTIWNSAFSDISSTGATEIQLCSDNVGNASNTEGVWGEITLINPMRSATYTTLFTQFMGVNSSGVADNYVTSGSRLNAEANNAIQFYFSSGNIASIYIVMFGLKNA